MKRGKKITAAIVSAVLSLCTLFCGCGGKSEQSTATPPDYANNTEQFLIYSYHAVYDDWYAIDGERTTFESLLTQESAQKHKDAGFNVYFLNYVLGFNGLNNGFSKSKAKAAMDMAQESGMKCIVTENHLFNLSSSTTSLIVSPGEEADGVTTFASEAALAEFARDCLGDVIEHPAFYGVTVKDEPTYEMFTAMGQVYRAIKTVAPNAYVNMNLFPLDNSARSYYCENGGALNAKQAYKKYLEAFYEEVRPEIIQYDDYPLKGNNQDTAFVGANHLVNAQMVADFCRARNLKLYKVFQTCSYKTTSWMTRVPTETDMYWQMNIGMAMGIKGYSYWTYYPTVNTAGEYYVDTACFVDRKGNPNPIYYTMQKIHGEMQSTSKALMNFEYQGLRTYVKTPIPGDFAYLNGLDMNEFVYVKDVITENEGIILVTELYDAENDQYGYYVVNATAPTVASEIKTTLKFKNFKNVQVYKNGETKNEQMKNGEYTVTLSGGRGVFVLPY